MNLYLGGKPSFLGLPFLVRIAFSEQLSVRSTISHVLWAIHCSDPPLGYAFPLSQGYHKAMSTTCP